MEQQKVLWIIFSVALFILVIVGVGVIWFLPSNHATVAQATTTQTGNQAKISFDPYEWAQSQNNNYPGLENSQNGKTGSQGQGQGGGNFTIIYGQQPSGHQAAPPSVEPSVTVAPSSAGAAVAPAPAPPPRRPAPKKAAPAPRQTPAPPPQRIAPTPAPAPAPPRPPAVSYHAPSPERVVQHWIQVAAYTSDFRAKRAKAALATNGIVGKIMSRDINGRTFFRVRVGPYPSQQEAEKFLLQIKRISEFKNSYISLVYATQ